ncbi:PRELI domain-containing protein 2-like [Panulirus ornatus]|uniref:PRELI domain-containing protein 2-like n=1 Tax=Panulirus ornatus TaxID=150431 RepID=UPI003A8A5D1F
MTVKVKSEHVYQEPVEIVAATHLTKFPNEYDPNILSCNVIEKRRDRDGRTYTKRVAAVRNVLPTILRRVESLQVDNFEVEEECLWDRRFRKFSVRCRNLSVTDWVTLNEASLFEPHKQNPNWTHFEQEGTITVHGLGSLGSLIEIFGKRFLSVGAQRAISITEKLMAEKSKRIISFWYSEFLFA